MSTSVNTFIEEMVRPAVRDTDSDAYRWESAAILGYIDNGQQIIVGRHPSAKYTDNTDIVLTVPKVTAGGTLGICDRWVSALLHYVAAQLLNEDSDDAANASRAAVHQAQFNEEVYK